MYLDSNQIKYNLKDNHEEKKKYCELCDWKERNKVQTKWYEMEQINVTLSPSYNTVSTLLKKAKCPVKLARKKDQDAALNSILKPKDVNIIKKLINNCSIK